MKKIIYLFLIAGFLNSCRAQIKTNSNNKKKMIPIIDKKFEIFNREYYDRLYKINPNSLNELLSNGNYIEIVEANSGLAYREFVKDSYFIITKGYFKNGKIKGKGLVFNNKTFQKGIWYEFDESGQLIKEIDYDEPYKFTFENIIEFCKNEKIPLQKGPILQSTGYHTAIRRDFNTESSWWQIEWLKKPNVIEIITLDGKTGKVLKRQETEYSNN